MTLWRRTSGAFKDRNSIWLASMARRTSYRHPELEAAIIKATSHDEKHVDYRNAQRVFQWLRTSPAHLRPLIWSLSRRMRRTSSWVVALKGLILMHGVFCCKTPNARRIGRLPFDLSAFLDAHSANPATTWPYSAFVRVYFAFLDQRAAYLCSEEPPTHLHNETPREEKKDGEAAAASCSIGQELVRVQKCQTLLDLLLKIKPYRSMEGGDLILEAMDCVIIEIYDIYSSICSGIARVLARIYAARSFEASIALRVLNKATAQIDKLANYFQFCCEIGVLSSSELPKVDQIPQEDIRELERIIAHLSNDKDGNNNNDGSNNKPPQNPISVDAAATVQVLNSSSDLKTVITDKWEVFDDIDHHQHHHQGMAAAGVGNSTMVVQGGSDGSSKLLALPAAPWETSPPPLIIMDDLPDLISF